MPTTILLGEHSLVFRRGKEERIVAYAGIREVKLRRAGRRLFITEVIPSDGKPISICNKYYTNGKNVEDRSRTYSTFVRILHFHLKDKSKAIYAVSGRKPSVDVWLLFAAVMGFPIAFAAEYFGITLLGPLADGGLLAAALGATGLAVRMGTLPKVYEPANIPLEFLP